MNSLGNKRQAPRFVLGGKLEGEGSSLGEKVTTSSKGKNKIPHSLNGHTEHPKKSPLEAMHKKRH
jgi:hypothetical protein